MIFAVTVLAAGLLAGFHAGKDAPQLQGVRLEMSKARVHALLSRVAVYKSQDENQEVWSMKSDPSTRSLIVGYAPDNHVRYITSLARNSGAPLTCKPLGDVTKAQKSGTAEEYVYTRSWKEHSEAFVATARGTAGHLTMCSVKKLGVGIENEEEEHENRRPSR